MFSDVPFFLSLQRLGKPTTPPRRGSNYGFGSGTLRPLGKAVGYDGCIFAKRLLCCHRRPRVSREMEVRKHVCTLYVIFYRKFIENTVCAQGAIDRRYKQRSARVWAHPGKGGGHFHCLVKRKKLGVSSNRQHNVDRRRRHGRTTHRTRI